MSMCVCVCESLYAGGYLWDAEQIVVSESGLCPALLLVLC